MLFQSNIEGHDVSPQHSTLMQVFAGETLRPDRASVTLHHQLLCYRAAASVHHCAQYTITALRHVQDKHK